ncbi:MAG: hypothetical protein RR411_01145 [Chryseobacterium sp.]|uniref:hypothetical protein n=1 Tax=Chryseobacterium sp. TaxID=1871047 RepID=UPI002FC9B7F1
MEDYIYKNIDLRTASQKDLCEALEKDYVFVSFSEELSDDFIRVSGLFAFADMYSLKELQGKLVSIYGDSY